MNTDRLRSLSDRQADSVGESVGSWRPDQLSMTLEPTGPVRLIAKTGGASAGGGSSVRAWPGEYFHDGRHEHSGL
jgi:hypothetical protein